jgi:uncharacterized protein (DUF1810 family)
MKDPYDLQRFVAAQERAYKNVLAELRRGRKTSHWIWYIFPQLAGLGSSPTSQRFAIQSLDEANAYLAHPLLGHRLDECTRLMIELQDRPLRGILGYPDDLKFRSCMTLFAEAAVDGSVFEDALTKLCEGERDPMTLRLLGIER